MSLKAVNSAKEVVLVGTGEGKKGVVGAAFTWAGAHKELPCTLIEGDPLWLVDSAAAEELPAELKRGGEEEHCERRARRLQPAQTVADESAWFSEWRERLECWWIATPYQAGLQACMGALSLAVARSFQAALGGSRAAQPGDVAAAESGCEWVQKPQTLQLPDFPDLGNFEFTVPPVPRLVPSWEHLHSLVAPKQIFAAATPSQAPRPLSAPATSVESAEITSEITYVSAVGAGAGAAAGVLGFALVVGVGTRLTSRVQIRRESSSK